MITGTSLAAEPSRSAVLHSLEIAKKNNIPVFMDIDYRPYTWESDEKASEIYNIAIKNCSGVTGNDEEFGIDNNRRVIAGALSHPPKLGFIKQKYPKHKKQKAQKLS